MKINYTNNINSFKKLVLIPVFETEEAISFSTIKLSKTIFLGKKDSVYIIQENNNHFIFFGLGKEANYKTIKTAFRRIAAKQNNYFTTQASLIFPNNFIDEHVEAAISGLLLGTYSLAHFKKEKTTHALLNNDFQLEICSINPIELAVERGIKIAKAQLETFTLVDLPPNVATPKYLANWAIKAGQEYGFNVTVFNKNQSKEKGLNAFLAVAQGSEQEPQFIIMNYKPTNAKKHIGLVGKGITFDTGGLNIKTAGMVHMKCDMAGGAAVLGTMQLIANLQLPYQVTAIVPACENSVDAKSFLPSDIITSYSGNTIEIIDTDAEGRLILADGLSYLIKNYNPEIVLDIATLTGSSVGTFGYECGALFSNNNELCNTLKKSGDEVGERLWQLPLWDAYKSDIDSDIADVKNYSGKPVAGAISAAKFLEFFTDNHHSWAHLDIAGVAFIDDEFAKTKHASAYGVHLITKFIQNL